MNWFNAWVLYAITWWTVLFAVLPFGTKPVAEPDSVTGWRGVPARPMIGRKLLATTLVTTVIWGVGVLLMRSDWFDMRALLGV